MIEKWSLRACHPSIFSSIAIELYVLRDDFSSIMIELTFVILRQGLKKPVQSSMIFVRLGQGIFKPGYITRYLHTWSVFHEGVYDII